MCFRHIVIILRKFATNRKYMMASIRFVETVMMEKAFHKIISEKLKDKNLSEISRKLGIPRSILQDWIHEGRAPSLKNIKHLRKLADFLELSLEELLTGEKISRNISTVTFEDDDRKYKVTITRIK